MSTGKAVKYFFAFLALAFFIAAAVILQPNGPSDQCAKASCV